MSSPTISEYDDLLERNKAVAKAHPGVPFLLTDLQAKGSLAKIDILVVTCADGRCDPHYFLSPKPLEMIVFRNLGGRVEAELPHILATDALVGFKQIWVIHHNDCGATLVAEDAVRSAVGGLPGVDPKTVEGISWPVFTDDEKSVRDDVAFLKSTPLLRKELADEVHGFLYDVKTGLLSPVV